MKLNDKAIKKLPHGKAVLSLLKTIDKNTKAKNMTNSGKEVRELLHYVEDSSNPTLTTLTFLQLIGFLHASPDFSFITGIRELKNTTYQRKNLEDLDGSELQTFIFGMYLIRHRITFNEKIDTDQEKFISLYLREIVQIYCHSTDVLVFEKYKDFSQAIKVKCPHCGNQIHSLTIHPDPSKSSKIQPKFTPKQKDQTLFFDDVYAFFYQLCLVYQEEHYLKILPYIYGTYQCAVCHEKNSVIDSIKEYQFQEEPPFLASDPFLEQVKNLCFLPWQPSLQPSWEMIRYYVSLHRNRKDLDSLEAYIVPLEWVASLPHEETISQQLPQLGMPQGLPRGYEILVEEVVEGLAQEGHSTLTRGKVLCSLAYFLQKQGDEDGFIKDASTVLAYYTEAEQLIRKELGEEHPEYLKCFLRKLLFRSQMGRNLSGQVDPLLDVYNTMDKTKHPDLTLEIERRLSDVYSKAKYFRLAGVYLEKTIPESVLAEETFYGQNVQVALETAGYYLQGDEFTDAHRLLRKILEINIPLLTANYTLPPLISPSKNKGKPLKKEEKEDFFLRKKVRETSFAYLMLGDISFHNEIYTESLDHCRKALELYLWVFPDTPEDSILAEFNYKLARSYWKLEDKKSAQKSCKTALHIYDTFLKSQNDPKMIKYGESDRANCIILQDNIKNMNPEA